MSDDLKPWNRRDNESSPAWEAFVTYRDMGTARSTASVAHSLGKSKTLMDRWSANNQWSDRVVSFDRYMDTESVDAYREQVKGIVKQQTELADKLLRHLDKTLDSNIASRTDPSIRWTTAFTAATKVQGGAMDMVKDKSDATTDTVKAIERIIERLTREDDE